MLRAVLMGGAVLVVGLVGLWLWLSGGRYVVVEDAYVRAAKLMVTTEVSGIVARVEVREGARVKKGDVLFRLDPRRFDIAVANAKAALAQKALSIKAMKLEYRQLKSEIAAQQAQVDLGQKTFARYQNLVAKKAISQAIYDQVRFNLIAARRKLESLQQKADVQLTKLGGDPDIPVAAHPEYLQARAGVDEARRQRNRTIVRAPFSGIVTKVDALQPGTYLVAPTAALTNRGAVALVGTDDVWIDANVKETSLTHIRPDNPVKITIDTYPGHTWRGKVASISPASGAEFSILPSQNASGNWVKITQRVPLRIAVEGGNSKLHLRAGMSAVVRIDTGHQRSIFDLFGWGPKK